jgi:hypothetical protein
VLVGKLVITTNVLVESQPVRNGRRQRARDHEDSPSDSDSPIRVRGRDKRRQRAQNRNDSLIESLSDYIPTRQSVEVDEQFAAEMATYDRQLARAQLAHRRFEAIVASERMEGVVQGGNTQGGNAAVDSDSSELSTMSSRISDLDKDWLKEPEKGKEPGKVKAKAPREGYRKSKRVRRE